MKVAHMIHRTFYPLYEQIWIERYRKIKEDDIYVDVGSYIGEFLPYASKKVGKHGKVIAIEPIPHNLEALKELLKNFNYSNVILVENALSDRAGTLIFDAR